MKSVFVPTDFSTYAMGGIKLASYIAQKAGCPIVLHHNVKSLVKWDGLSQAQKMDHPVIFAKTVEAEQRLDKTINEDFDKELEVRKLLTHGATFEEIVVGAKEARADLIIMGSHGNENSDRFFIGSNIQRVIRFAECPVLAVKSEDVRKEIKNIVFPFQFDQEAQQPFDEIKKMAKLLDATIHILYVNTPGKFKETRIIRKEMEEFARQHADVKFELSVYSHSDAITGIIEYCEENPIDMIALITHDRRHAAKYLIGVTESLVFHSHLPVLSVNARIFEPVLT